MDVLEAILSRRSIRRYTAEPVPEEVVDTLLNAAMNAPSGDNEQPWHFIVVTDRAILDAVPTFHTHARMMGEAPVAIIVCGDPRLEKHSGLWLLDCSAATENILLAAHGAGLGAVWVSIYPWPERIDGMRKLVGLPDAVIPFCIVPVGFPAVSKPKPDRFDRLRVHRNVWEGDRPVVRGKM